MKKLSQFLLVWCGLILVCASDGWTQSKNHERTLFDKALNLYESGYYKSAYEKFSKLTMINPSASEYFLYAGLSLINTTDSVSNALIWFNRGLQCDSVSEHSQEIHDDLMLAKGEALQVLNRYDEAVELYNALISSSVTEGVVDEAREKKQQAQRNKILIANAISAKINNLGKPINSHWDDHSGCFNMQGDKIYFTSKRNDGKNDDGQERIFVSEKGDSSWSSPRMLPVFRKNFAHEAVSSLSSDESVMAVFHSMDGHQDIYTMKNEHGNWQQPTSFTNPITSNWNQTHISFSPDLSTVFFTSDRPGGFGGMDIYMSKLLDNNQWSPARNLGPNINTPKDEETPFMHANGHTLYFASEGHNGMGRFDIFFSEMQPDSSFVVASNMGYPVNTIEDDFAFSADISNRQALLSSTRNDRNFGGSDLFMVDLDSSYNSQVAVLKLVADDSLGTVTRVLIKRQVDSLLVGDYRPNMSTGEYTAFLETNYGYSVMNRTDSSEYCARTLYLPDSLAYYLSRQTFMMEDVPLFVEVIVAPPQPKESVPELLPSTSHGFTIQVTALKRKPLFVSSYLKGLTRYPVRQVRCGDGYVRYLYGSFNTRKEARAELLLIRKSGRYADAFIRTNQSIDIQAIP